MEWKGPPYRSILFVCDGNTCRSPMAEAILKRMLADFEGKTGKIEVRSGGIVLMLVMTAIFLWMRSYC